MEFGRNAKQFMSALLVLVMVLSWVPGSALTTQATEMELCEHHTEHTADCGYRAAAEAAPCKYDGLCDKGCADSDGDGQTDHARDCAYTRELEKDLCSQGCQDTDGDGFADHAEDCAFTQAKGVHEHSEKCGYQEADAGSPCTHQCDACKPQEAHIHAFTYTVNADDTHTKTCPCGETLTEPHTYAYTNDGETHTALCLCGASLTEPHTYTYTNDGETHTALCVCGVSLTEPHTYTYTVNPDGTHTQSCPCGASLTESHTYTYTANPDGTHTQSCPCGASLTESHTYTYTANPDGTHTTLCPCGASAAEPHTYTDGACTSCGAAQPAPLADTDPVAEVTIDGATTSYTDFADAWTAANGKTAIITLKSDVTLTSELIMDSGDITMEGGNYTISATGRTTPITICGGHFTLASGTVSSDDGSAITVSNEGSGTPSFTMTGGTLHSARSSGLSANGGNVTIQNGTLTGDYSGADFINSNIAISGGTFTGGAYGVQLTTSNWPANLAPVATTITGGTFNCNVTGGKSLSVELTKQGDTVSISGGSFPNGIENKTTDASINNGTSEALLAPGCTLNADGTITKPAPVATVNGTEYTNFTDAWTAACAVDSATITLCSDITLTESLKMSQGSITLKGGDYTITSAENVSPVSIGGGTFTLDSGTILALGDHNDAISIDKPTADVTVTVKGGTLTGGNVSGGGLYAENYFDKNVSVTVNGGTFSGFYGARLVNCNAEINNGTFTGTTGLDVKLLRNGSEANISGGEFTGTENGLSVQQADKRGNSVTISGGTFTGTNGYGIYVTPESLSSGEIVDNFTIEGGNFNGIKYETYDGTPLSNLMAPGFTIYDDNGTPIDISNVTTLKAPAGHTLTPNDAPTDLDFTNTATPEGNLDTDGYHWDAATSTLTLKGLNHAGDITLPDNVDAKVVTESASTVKGNIKFGKSYAFHVTFSGSAPLTVTGKIGQAGTNDSEITVAQGANVIAQGGVEASADGKANGTVTVNGALTSHSGTNYYGGSLTDAVSTGKVVVGPSGHLTVKGPNGVAVGGMGNNFAGVFTIKPGGKFTGECANYNIACFSPSGNLQGCTPEQIFVFPNDHYLPNGWTKQMVGTNGAAVIAPVGSNPHYENYQLVGAGGAPLSIRQHDPHSVAVSITGQGTVDVSAATKLQDEKSFYEGETVALNAIPAKGYHLDSLNATQNGSAISLTPEGSGACTFEMPDADVTVTAVFLADPKPSDPSDPSDPDDKPTKPSDPDDKPTKPSDPDDKPTNPSKPDDKPTNPSKPDDKPTKPTGSTKPTKPVKPTATPGTGDTANILTWTILMFLSFATAASLLYNKRRSSR